MAVATPTLLGRPVWYELMTTDMKAAENFYGQVIGWNTAPFEGAGQPYTQFNRGNDAVAGVMTKPAEVKAPPFWAMYVAVPDLDEANAKITRLGGKAHTETMQIPSVGRLRMMMDPQGAAFYIIEPSDEERRPEGSAQIGDASWHELMTTDMTAAMKFYQDVFGWQPSDSMDMGDMGTYQMFNRPHGMIGGMMNKPPQMANVPPNWQIYFRVPDVHAATERIKANGGKILNGPMEVPGGDWAVNAMDPQGAAFGLHHKKS
jgi:hypothetical protein